MFSIWYWLEEYIEEYLYRYKDVEWDIYLVNMYGVFIMC